jgi:hypothetical protein
VRPLVKTGGRFFFGWHTTVPRNLAPDFLQYMGERPEVLSRNGTSPKAKTMKGK